MSKDCKSLLPASSSLQTSMGLFCCAGFGFGNLSSLASVHAASSTTDLNITSISPTSLTFITPPIATATNGDFFLTVNNATSSFRVNYTLAATPSLVDVQGDFPTVDGELVLPSTAAVPLMIIGDGFGDDRTCVTVSHFQQVLQHNCPTSTVMVCNSSPMMLCTALLHTSSRITSLKNGTNAQLYSQVLVGSVGSLDSA